LPDEETSSSREIAQNMDDLEQKNKDGTEPFLKPLGPAEQTVVDRVMEEFWAILTSNGHQDSLSMHRLDFDSLISGIDTVSIPESLGIDSYRYRIDSS
jgi:hypothetical protein